MPRIIARTPTTGEVERAAEVASKAFTHIPLEHWQTSFHDVAEMFGEKFIVVGELDGQIVSSLLCCPAPIVVFEGAVTHSSVGGVGTLPEYRKMGCAGAILTQSVKVLREEGIHTSSLWPFSYEYYRKFGWEAGAELRTYSGKAEVFAPLGDASKARPAKSDDFDGIAAAYEEFALCYNCCGIRSEEWWRKVVMLPKDLKMIAEPGRGAVVLERDGETSAYAVYDIVAKEDGKSIEVKEVVFSYHEDRRHLLALIATIDGEAAFSFSAPNDDLFLQEIPNPRAVNTGVRPSFQFRIIDPEAALNSLRVDDSVSGKFTLSLSDPVFKHGWEFGVEIDEGDVTLCKPQRAGRLEMDVQTFARLYSGYLSPLDAWGIGHLQCDDPDAMALAFGAFSALEPYRSWLEPG